MIRWVAFQPLIGGMALGAEKAFGSTPLFVIDYKGVDNSKAYVNYMNDIRKSNLKHLILDGDLISKSQVFENKEDREFFLKECHDIDVVCAVPICSGLSFANNCVSGKKARGSNAIQNNNMIGITEFALSIIQPKAYIFENAPALFSKNSESLREQLNEIATSNGYSVTYVKTNSNLHNNVQYRQRTFAIFWNSKYCPVLNPVNNKCGTIKEFLSSIDENAPYQTSEYNVFDDFENNTYIKYIKKKYGSDYRRYWAETGYLSITNLIEGLNDFEYASEIVDEKAKEFLKHIQEKRSLGKNYFDCGPLWYGEYKVPTIFGRTINRLVHPSEERGYNIRELLKFMGMPDDFVFDDPIKNKHFIGQNVPVDTAKDWCLQIKDFLNGKLKFSTNSVSMFDNVKQSEIACKKVNKFVF